MLSTYNGRADPDSEKPPVLRTDLLDTNEYIVDASPNEIPRDILSAVIDEGLKSIS